VSAEKTLLRPRDGRVIAGVCAAFARHLKVDAVLLRGAAIVLGLLGIGIVAYLVLWILVAEE
jgi:phage shock protein PspC (stress-responsive transcriptional regulator)